MKTKYTVTVHILKSDINGKFSSEDYEYSFQEPTLIESRNKAIEKAKSLKSHFENDMKEGEQFSSPLVAQLKSYKDFNAYSIGVFFINDEGYDYQIYGEEELTIEALSYEANHYRKVNQDDQELIEVEDLDGDYVEVLEHDYEFFMEG